MAQNRLLIAIAGSLVALLFAARACTFVVKETETAIVIELGSPKGVIAKAGLNLKLPWADIVKIDKRNLEYDLVRAMDITDLNQERLTVDAFARYRIIDPLV